MPAAISAFPGFYYTPTLGCSSICWVSRDGVVGEKNCVSRIMGLVLDRIDFEGRTLYL